MMPGRDPGEESLPWAEIEARIRCAVRELQAADGFLLEVDANERTITHRLAIYLEAQFSGWHVDVEYNREGKEGDPKRLNWDEIAAGADANELVRDTEGRTIYPDIIVHERGEPNSLLVIEVKKSGSRRPADVDREKLAGMGDTDGLGYCHAVFLQLPVGDDADTLVLERIE